MKNNRYSISIRHALMLLVLLLGFPYFGYAANNEDFVYKNVRYRGININEAKVVGCSKNSKDLKIPPRVEYKGISYEITIIDDEAFIGCTDLTSIDLNYAIIRNIGSSAFKGCSSLRSIRIPEEITSIGESAFEGCSGLTSIDISCYHYNRNENLSIGESAFEGCSGLTSVKIPERVTSIGNYAFEGCSGLTSVEIPNSVTSISIGSFLHCIYNHRTTKTNQKYPSVNL